MKVSRNKNIFNDFLYDRKSLTVNNVIIKFGSRIIDLYTTFPINIVQENLIEKLQIKYQNHLVTIDLKVIDYLRKYNKKSPFKVICEYNFKQKIFLLYFNLFENQIKNFLIKNQSYRISGKLEIQKNSFQIIHPNVVSSSNLENYELIYPEYDLARKKINKKIFRNILNKNFNILENYQFPYEWISDTILIREEWMSCKDSLLKIHKPSKLINKSDLELLRKRLSFDELLASYLTFY